MRVLLWHVHGSWTNALVQGEHEYLLPVVPGRGDDGRGRAQTWDWPDAAVEVPVEELRETEIDAVILQRTTEVALLRLWTGRTAGIDVPAVYVEHNAPTGRAAASLHPLADQDAIPVVHITHFNRLMWDCGAAPTLVVAWDLSGKLSVPALADLVAGAPLLLCGDTGPAHLATAYGTPSVLLFGPTAPDRWGPAIDPHLHTVLWHEDAGRGDPHADEINSGLAAIDVDEVLSAAADMLEGRNPVGAPRPA